MSHGPGYEEPDGYDPQHNFALAASFVPTSRHETQPVRPYFVEDGQSAPSSYLQHAIPGLGLGYQRNSIDGHSLWAGDSHASMHSSFQASPATNNSHYNTMDNASATVSATKRVRDVCSEDGEISDNDNELDSMYEPMESRDKERHNAAAGKVANTAAPILSTGSHDKPYSSIVNVAERAGYRNDPRDSRERSGSYSPYLSPHEISQPDDTTTHLRTGPVPGRHSGTDVVFSLANDQQHTPIEPNVADAKRRAKDAILRLWPLNMRFQNYVAEGIDESLLKSLFSDLGLTIPEKDNTVQNTNTKNGAAAGPATVTTPVAVDKTKAKGSDARAKESEERKDRIARLLAQKGPKKTATNTTAVLPEVVQPVAKSSSSALTQSQKSKLLQEKMAALKKSREELKREHSHLMETTNSETAGSGPETKPMPLQGNGRNSPPTASVAAIDGNSNIPGSGNEVTSPSIPGLSISQVDQWSRVANAQHGPQHSQESKLNRPQNVEPPRPFDQNIKSKPFLIDVSDDEDDADMEIDSPGPHESSTYLIGTPPRTSTIRDVAAISDSFLARLAQSPSAIASPQRSVSRNNGGSDLESMNKKIEEMKRKIAEAEARKKAKHSRQGSPALSSRNESSHDDASEPPSRGLGSKTPSYSDIETRKGPATPRLDRPIRLRAASERLPLLEARRKEQLLKLKNLQSEVARIEKELEADMMEEERLKEGLSQSDLEQDSIRTDSAQSSAVGGVVAMLLPVETAVGDSTPSDTRSDAAEQPPMDVECGVQDKASSEDLVAATDKSDESSYGESVHEQNSPAASHQMAEIESVNNTSNHSIAPSTSGEKPEDTVMEDTGYSADEDMEDTSDDYEPAEVMAVNTVNDVYEIPAAHDAEPADNSSEAMDLVVSDLPATSTTSVAPVDEEASATGKSDGLPSDANPLQASQPQKQQSTGANGSSFMPYETPLQYFHAYRFHPSFSQSVSGGLRSLTYSNKIDVQKELCPDELAGQTCPRGTPCKFQHFDKMQAADDQILLQLGAAEDYDEQQKQEYIAGLRELLTDFRDRKVKDFNTISQGIIDYRAQFLGDKTKILPLNGVSI